MPKKRFSCYERWFGYRLSSVVNFKLEHLKNIQTKRSSIIILIFISLDALIMSKIQIEVKLWIVAIEILTKFFSSEI